LPRTRLLGFEDLVHGGRGFGERWADLVAVDRFGDRGTAVAHQVADVLDPDVAVVAEDGHEAVAQLPGGPVRPEPGRLGDLLELAADLVPCQNSMQGLSRRFSG
jgi:hypothetical protein